MRLPFLLLGHACLAIGAVGLFVPLLPTTPFILLAAWFYSKGSKRLHRWLTAHPRFGRPVRDWQQHGVIRPRAKWISTLLIVASLSYPILFQDLPLAAKTIAGLVGLGVLIFIHSRPSHSKDAKATLSDLPEPSRIAPTAATHTLPLPRNSFGPPFPGERGQG